MERRGPSRLYARRSSSGTAARPGSRSRVAGADAEERRPGAISSTVADAERRRPGAGDRVRHAGPERTVASPARTAPSSRTSRETPTGCRDPTIEKPTPPRAARPRPPTPTERGKHNRPRRCNVVMPAPPVNRVPHPADNARTRPPPPLYRQAREPDQHMPVRCRFALIRSRPTGLGSGRTAATSTALQAESSNPDAPRDHPDDADDRRAPCRCDKRTLLALPHGRRWFGPRSCGCRSTPRRHAPFATLLGPPTLVQARTSGATMPCPHSNRPA